MICGPDDGSAARPQSLKRVTGMVAGEPNDVRLKNVDGEWIVQIVENGKVTRHSFKTQVGAEGYAEFQRIKLGLPGKPPIWEENLLEKRPKKLR